MNFVCPHSNQIGSGCSRDCSSFPSHQVLKEVGALLLVLSGIVLEASDICACLRILSVKNLEGFVGHAGFRAFIRAFKATYNNAYDLPFNKREELLRENWETAKDIMRLLPESKPELTCAICDKPITDGHMIGTKDVAGQSFAHPDCYRELTPKGKICCVCNELITDDNYTVMDDFLRHDDCFPF